MTIPCFGPVFIGLKMGFPILSSLETDIPEEVLRAEERIRPHIRQTILEYSPFLSQLGEANIYCKLENLQHTGSFKVRGAMNKLLSLTAGERARGVVTASTGNHGMAVAWSLNKLNASGIIFVPENATPSKIQAIERIGAEVRYFGQDTVDTEVHARQYAAQNHLTYVPPYNDPQVVGGQGTIGVELARQLDQIDAVFVSLGGGGLVSGIAGYLKSVHPGVQIIGCSPENSQVMIQSVRAGEILDLPSLPTLSDGTAGGVEAGSITFELCRILVDEYVTVTEYEIKESLRLFVQTHHMLIEGSAAVSIASYLKIRRRFAGKNVAIIICGANISPETLKKVL
jgi:threonine dehydratase